MTLTRHKQLRRGKPLAARPRAKGNRAELAVRNIIRDYGWTRARRNFQSGGQGGSDIIEGPPDLAVEVKWCERADIWAWLRQVEADARPTDIPAVICRCNALPWSAVLPLDEWEALRRLDEQPTFTVTVEAGRRLRFWEALGEAVAGAGVSGVVPVLRFARAGSGVYVCVPFGELLRLLRLRESA